MTPTDIQLLVDYNYWARDRLLAAVEALSPDAFTRDMGSSFGSVRDTLAHVYGAEWIWLARWRGEAPTALPTPGQFPDVATLRRTWTALEGEVRAFVAGLDQAGRTRLCDYRLLSGQACTSPFGQMIQHVVNHGTYHRGQVVTMLRQMGAAGPQALDLIAFYREREQVASPR